MEKEKNYKCTFECYAKDETENYWRNRFSKKGLTFIGRDTDGKRIYQDPNGNKFKDKNICSDFDQWNECSKKIREDSFQCPDLKTNFTCPFGVEC